jgi:Zn-dependent peptidase ImmA (M78 family)
VYTFAQIKIEAQRVTRQAGLDDVIPVPLERIAHSLGFESLAFDGQADLAGAIEYSKRQIFINSNDPATRQRFTLAHELGHAVMHSGQDIMDFRKNLEGFQPDRKELEANAFAADLLMPDHLFKEAWSTRQGKFSRIAALFGVSLQAAEIKAKNLGLS